MEQMETRTTGSDREAGAPSQDRTFELEQHLKAIRINGEDCCAFFMARAGGGMCQKKCCHCAHGKFTPQDVDCVDGLCKFKP